MKNNGFFLLYCFSIFALVIVGCSSSKQQLEIGASEKRAFNEATADTVEIAHPESNYEIIIIEPGFNVWLQSVARQEGYYSQHYLENRNRLYVIAWNNRVLNSSMFDPNLYQMQIDYDPSIDYGYEVNYKLYNYFIYFQRKYNQRLGPWIPRI